MKIVSNKTCKESSKLIITEQRNQCKSCTAEGMNDYVIYFRISTNSNLDDYNSKY